VRWGRVLGLAVLGAWAAVAWWGVSKPLPAGTHIASPPSELPAQDVGFIADITAADAFGRPIMSQGIFDAVLRTVQAAREFVVVDYARFGGADDSADATPPLRPLSAQLSDALIAQHREQPQLRLLVITDPQNDGYGAQPDTALEALRGAGIDVVTVDLRRLRDSNPLYTAFWRLALSWWDGPGSPLRGDSQRLNFKRDHRKVVIADDGAGQLAGVVGSANPYDPQSAWSNAAVRIRGAPLAALLASELALARDAGWQGNAAGFALPPASAVAAAAAADFTARVQTLTEGATRAALLEHLNATGRGDAIDVAAFYLADRAVIDALLAADARGAAVRVLLDPQVGSEVGATAGIPNQPVASELESKSGGAIRVRWYRTHGERFHASLVMIYGEARLWFTAGSADLTRRSLDDYNLEANAALEVPRASALGTQLVGYFDTLWSNRAELGIEYSSDFAVYADPSQMHYWFGRAVEASGLGDF
jgi:phosphatidylserine/phosphatidylglycerophosphate/cardiolipin synthase-like enzyme